MEASSPSETESRSVGVLTAPPTVLAQQLKPTLTRDSSSSTTLSRSAAQLEQGGTNLNDRTPTVCSSSVPEKDGVEKVDLDELAALEAARPAAPHFPDGGLQAYLAALGGSLVLMSTFGFSNAWGAVQAELQRRQLSDHPSSVVALIGSLHLGILFACGLGAGRIFDLGYFRYQLAFGSVLWVFGVLMLSLSTEYYQFILSYSVCMGLALGCVFAPTVSCVGSYFLLKRSVMMGSVAAGAALGAVWMPIALNILFPRVGFATTIRILGGIIAACLIIANIIMRPRDLPPKKSVHTLPLLAGFLRQKSTWFGCGGAGFVMLGMFIPLFYVQIFFEANGADQVVVDYSLALINATATISRLVMGLVADRFGIYNTAVPVAFSTAVLIFAMLGATSTGAAVTFCLLYGWFSGAWVTHMAPSLMSLALDVSEIGARAGLGFLFVSVAVLLGNPIAGALLRGTGGYVAPVVFGGASVLVGTGLLACARQTQVKRRSTWKV